MLFADLGIFLVLSLAMTLAYPVKVAMYGNANEPDKPIPTESSTHWKLGLEFEMADVNSAGIALGIAAEHTLSERTAIRATLMSNGVSLGLPIQLLGSYNGWAAPWKMFPNKSDHAYLFARPEIGFRKYTEYENNSADIDERGTGTSISQASAGVSLGSGYRLVSESGIHFWVQSWVGYRVYKNYLADKSSSPGVFGFDMGIEF